MDEKVYYWRTLVKRVISFLKRKYDPAVNSQVWWQQFREMVAIYLVYNVERAMKLGVTLLDRLLTRLPYFPQWRISTESWEINSPGVSSLKGPCSLVEP